MRERILELERACRVLDPGPAERERLRLGVEGLAEAFLASLAGGRPAFDERPAGDGLADLPIGAEGAPLDRILEVLERDVLSPGGNPAAPGHLAYLTGGGLFHSALGDALGAVTNKYAGIAFTGPGPVRMEGVLVRWVADLVGYPATGGGSLQSGGSLANLTALVAARDSQGIRASEVESAVAYFSGQTHHSIRKALRIAGLGEGVVRSVHLDARHRMDPEDLRRRIATDRAAGLRPWLIVANAGSTDTGAVDPLDELASIAEEEGCWFHVDAAYGGFFLLTADGRRVLRGIGRSDSVILDPHKSLFLPWGTGIVLARDAARLVASFDETGAYLQDARDVAEISPADVSPELTKPFRALRMWLPLVLLGVEPFRAALEEKLLLARYFRDRVQELGFRVGPPPDLSVVTFRWAPDGLGDEAADRINRDIASRLRRDGRIFLSTTELGGRFTLRAAPLAHRTHLATVDLLLELLATERDRARTG